MNGAKGDRGAQGAAGKDCTNGTDARADNNNGNSNNNSNNNGSTSNNGSTNNSGKTVKMKSTSPTDFSGFKASNKGPYKVTVENNVSQLNVTVKYSDGSKNSYTKKQQEKNRFGVYSSLFQ